MKATNFLLVFAFIRLVYSLLMFTPNLQAQALETDVLKKAKEEKLRNDSIAVVNELKMLKDSVSYYDLKKDSAAKEKQQIVEVKEALKKGITNVEYKSLVLLNYAQRGTLYIAPLPSKRNVEAVKKQIPVPSVKKDSSTTHTKTLWDKLLFRRK